MCIGWEDFDHNYYTFGSFGMLLSVLPGKSWVGVVEAEACGNGVTEGFKSALQVIRVQSASACDNEANDQALNAALRFRLTTDQCRCRSWFGLLGFQSTQSTILGGDLRFDPGAELGGEFGEVIVHLETPFCPRVYLGFCLADPSCCQSLVSQKEVSPQP